MRRGPGSNAETCPQVPRHGRAIMFKTVRAAPHGSGALTAELEYTILPQSDDRSPSASSSGGEDEPPGAGHPHRCRHHQYHQYHQQQQQHHHHHHHRQPHGDGGGGGDGDGDGVGAGTRRTVLVIIAMLVLGCGVVAAAVLVPILLAARLVSVPASARLQTFAVAASGVIHSARGDYVQLLPVKHAPPGTVIQFEPLPDRQQRQPPQPPTNRRRRRKRRATVAAAARRLRPPVAAFPSDPSYSAAVVPLVRQHDA